MLACPLKRPGVAKLGHSGIAVQTVVLFVNRPRSPGVRDVLDGTVETFTVIYGNVSTVDRYKSVGR